MKILGITAEYNPFHNGHKYHLEKSRELTAADCVVAVMSGNFTQRGEPALMDKWQRSRLAVDSGVDLVVELPFVFACNRGEIFASGAVDILAAMGANYISFGSESGDVEELRQLAEDMISSRYRIADVRGHIMSAGSSFAKATELAVEQVLGKKGAALMLEPNNILALEYLKRIIHHENNGEIIKPVTVKRFGSGYREKSQNSGFAGASAIRQMAASGQSAENFVPQNVWEAIASAENPERLQERAFQLIRSEIVKSSSRRLAEIYCMGEGLENKLKKEIIKAGKMQEFVSAVVSRRYTEAAVRRLLVYVLLGIRERELPYQIYARVLAANPKGRMLIRSIKQQDDGGIPIITNINKEERCQSVRDALAYDILASDMYNILRDRDLYRFSDKSVKPYIL